MRAPLALALLASAAPCAALALDRTAALSSDSRLRMVDYDPEQVALVYVRVGQATRIRIDHRERVVDGGVVYSDEATMSNADDSVPYTEEDAKADQQGGGRSGGEGKQSCNRNMCVSVVLNTVYIMPRVQLQPQSFFLRTEWCPEPGRCQPGEYAMELRTAKPDETGPDGKPLPRIETSFYGIQYRYPRREAAFRAEKAAEARREAAEKAREFRRNNPAPAPPSVPDVTARWDMGRCGSAPEIDPDEAWTDGRTTFLRYKGGRRVPNVYERREDGERTLTAYTVEPDAWGNTVRIGKVRPVFLLWDGERASCVVNVAPDTEGRTEMAVAPIREPLAGQPRRERRR